MRTIYPTITKALLIVAGLVSIPQIISAQTGMGVGTNTPAEKLDVNGAVKIGNTSTTNAGTIRWTGTDFEGYDGSQWITFGGGNAGWSLTGNNGTTPGTNFIGTTDNTGLVFRTNNNERMRLLSDGRLGIGTTSPSGFVEIYNTATNLRITDSDDNATIEVTAPGSGYTGGIGTTTNHDLPFYTNGVDKMVITTGGNIGIGTTTPQEKVHVRGGNLLLDRANSGNVTRSITLQGAGPIGTSYFGELMFKGYDNTSGSFEYEGAAIKARNLGSVNNGALTFWTRDTSLVEWMILNKNGVLQINPNGYAGNSGLSVEGSFKLENGSQAAGYVLQSDASGGATWVDPTTISTAADNDWLDNGNDMYNGNSGNVGVGTSTPQEKLHVNGGDVLVDRGGSNNVTRSLTLQGAGAVGTSNFGELMFKGYDNTSGSFEYEGAAIKARNLGSNNNGALTFWTRDTSLVEWMRLTKDGVLQVNPGGNSGNSGLQVDGSFRLADGSQTNGYVLQSDASGNATWVDPASLSDGDWATNGTHIYNQNTGNVGIGTNNPESELNIKVSNNGLNTPLTLRNGNDNQSGGNAVGMAFINNSGAAAPKAMIVNERTNGWGRGSLHFLNNDDNNTSAATLADARMTITSNGRVGIGTTNPAAPLEVSGNALVTNNVGIGTTSPQERLHIHTSNNGLNLPLLLRNANNTSSGGNATGIGFVNESGGNSVKAAIAHERNNSWGVGNMHFLVSNVASNTSVTLADARMTITRQGNVGIGTTNPNDELEVQGSIRMVDGNQANGYIPVSNANGTMTWTDPSTITTADDGDWASSGSHIYNANSGNVGIGTSSPNFELHVHDNGADNAWLQFTQASTGTSSSTDGLLIGIDNSERAVFQNRENTDMIFQTNSTEQVRITAAGNVGIGTSTPESLLNLKVTNNGLNTPLTLRNGNDTQSGGNAVGIAFSNNNGAVAPKAMIVNERTNGWGRGSLHFLNNDDNNASAATLSDARMTITSNGNVGIGTTSPSDELEVQGSIRMVDGNQANGYIPVSNANGTMTWTDPTTIATADDGDWTVNGNDQYSTVSGNVGVGVNTPTEKLHVSNGNVLFDRDTNNSNTIRALTIAGKLGGDVYPYASIDFRNYDDNDGNVDYVGASIRSHNDGSSDDGDLRFYTTSDQTLTEAVRIRRNGNVGIGTTSPSSALHVAANSASGPTVTIETGSNQYPSSVKISPSTHATSERATIEVGKWGILQDITGNGTEDFSIYNNNTSSQALTISTANNVGIGTTNATNLLSLGSTAGSSTSAVGGKKLAVYNSASGNDFYGLGVSTNTLQFHAQSTTSEEPDMVLLATGNVGIGTTTPQEKLEVQGSIRMVDGNQAAGYIPVSDANGTMTWTNPATIATDTLSIIADADRDTKIQTEESADEDKIRFDVAGMEVMVIDDTDEGMVGIGTSDPRSELHISDGSSSLKTVNDGGGYGASMLITDDNIPRVYFEAASQAANKKLMDISYIGQALSIGSLTDAGGAWDKQYILAAHRDGNVGVGTSNPSEALHIRRDGSDNYLRIDASSPSSGYAGIRLAEPTFDYGWFMRFDASSSGALSFAFNDNTPSTTDRMTILPAGNVGIGTTSPIYKLDVDGAIRTRDNYYLDNTNSSGSSSPDFRIDGYQDALYLIAESGTNGPTAGTEIRFRTAAGNSTASDKMVINKDGNVGIGTTTPGDKLHVEGNIRMVDGSQAAGYIPVSDANGTMTWTNPATIATADDGDWVANGTHIYKGNTGNVGLGTTTPSEVLDVWGNVDISAVSPVMKFSATGTPRTSNISAAFSPVNTSGQLLKFNLSDNTSTGTNEVMRMQGDGNVGIGTTNPGDKLDVAGNIRMVDGNQAAGYIPVSDANGTMSWTDPTTIATADDGDWLLNGNKLYNGNSGNVGIGTSNPSATLEIYNTVAGLKVTDSNNNSTIGMAAPNGGSSTGGIGTLTNHALPFFTNNTDRMILTETGNVGIATTTPGALFNVYEPDESTTQTNFTQTVGDAGLLVTSQFTNGAYTPGIFWNTSNNSSTLPKAGIYTQNTNTGSKLLFGTSNLYSSGITNTGLALSETGNVGIGTTSPADELEVQGSIRMVDGNQQNGYVAVSDANGTMSWADPATLSDGDWATNGSHIYNANSGNVGIGTNSPNHEMQIHDASSPNSWLQFTQSATGATSNDGFVIGVNNAEEVHLNQKENNDMVFKTNNSEKMRIMASGNVGIGTSNPTNALLEVDGSVGSHSLGSIGYLNTGGAGTGTYNGSFSIYASNRISGFAFIAHSDERIKDIKGISNSAEDLETLKKIEITDYQYIDKIGKGDGMQKKLIAQQVEKVYPQAVETNITEVVPDIYQLASINGGWVNLSTDLKVGDMVQLILDNSSELVEVIEMNENGFKVDLEAEGDVFVFGRQVDDFHTVDYEAISMLNVSATQELAKKLEVSEAKNLELEGRLRLLEAQLLKEKNDNQARLERIEAELGIGLSTQK